MLHRGRGKQVCVGNFHSSINFEGGRGGEQTCPFFGRRPRHAKGRKQAPEFFPCPPAPLFSNFVLPGRFKKIPGDGKNLFFQLKKKKTFFKACFLVGGKWILFKEGRGGGGGTAGHGGGGAGGDDEKSGFFLKVF